MDHSQYKQLISLFDSAIKGRKILFVLFEKDKDGKSTPRAKAQELYKVRYSVLGWAFDAGVKALKMLRQCGDGFIADVKSQGTNPNPDVMRLVQRMTNYVDLAPAPIDGIGDMYEDLTEECRDWLEQYHYLAPGGIKAIATKEEKRNAKVEKFKSILVETDQYKEAVKDGRIIPPFTWNPGMAKVALSRFIKPILLASLPGVRDIWTYVDHLFEWRGNSLSGNDIARQLNKM